MVRPNFAGEKATMLATLYGRALDARSPKPVLGDEMAAEIVEKLDFDWNRTGIHGKDHVSIAVRARHLDNWTREFLDAHPEATVLHLGCGLDSRVYRVDPGPGVRWFDVDYPEVIELRRELYPPRENCEMVASSVTEPDWLDRVPADRPVLVVAEGLTMYLKEQDGEELFRRIVERFSGGQFIFDALSRLGIKLQRRIGPVRAAGATLYWGIDSGAELEAGVPGVRCLTELSALTPPGITLPPTLRLLVRGLRLVPLIRRVGHYYRLEF